MPDANEAAILEFLSLRENWRASYAAMKRGLEGPFPSEVPHPATRMNHVRLIEALRSLERDRRIVREPVGRQRFEYALPTEDLIGLGRPPGSFGTASTRTRVSRGGFKMGIRGPIGGDPLQEDHGAIRGSRAWEWAPEHVLARLRGLYRQPTDQECKLHALALNSLRGRARSYSSLEFVKRSIPPIASESIVVVDREKSREDTS